MIEFSASEFQKTMPSADEDETGTIVTTGLDYFEDDLYTSITTNKKSSTMEYLRKGLSPNHAFRSTDRPSRLGKTMIEIAVSEGAIDVAKLLAARKCDVNLTYVVNVKNFTYQLEEFRKRNRLKLTCMYRCIVKNDLEMIRLLVNAGFDVNVYDDRGCTALWHAVDLDNYEMVKIMTGAKACDVNVNDQARLRPIHVSAMRGNVKMTSLLIQRGAGVDDEQLRGSTALILACRAASYDTVRILLLNGANPNHVGKNGHNVISTALQFTTDVRIPTMLLECGAYVDQELVQLIRTEAKKFLLLKEHPDFFQILKECSQTPRTMRTLCCLRIRRLLVQSRVNLHLIKKVERLPLPRLIKDYLLFGHV